MKPEDHHFLTPEIIEKAADIFKALSDPTRIKLLHLLAQEECSVSHIAELLEMSPSAVSHQLSYLRTIRLVKHRREGKTIYYTCEDEHVIHLLEQTIHHVTHG